MVDGAAFPALSAMGLVKMPPLVHPSTLAKAATLCVEFGGNSEALEAAALAGALIQARMLHAQRGLGNGSIGVASEVTAGFNLPQPSNIPRPPPPAPDPMATSASEISDQMKQAMAAAEATNTQPKPPQPPEPIPQVPPAPDLLANASVHGMLPGSEILPLVSPLAPTMAAMAQGILAASMQPPLLQHTISQPNPLLMPLPPPLPPQQPPPVQIPQLSQVGHEQREMRDIHKTSPQTVQLAKASPQGSQVEEKKKEKQKNEEPVSAPKEAMEPIRCHLHRKPNPNCKTCRRLNNSMLASDYDKMDRKKDASANDKEQSLEDEHGFTRREVIEAFEITNKQTYNFNAMLRDQILKSTYFKSLMKHDTFEGIVDQLYQFADTAEVYGAGTTTVPSTLFCCLFRFFTIGVAYDELHQLLNNKDSPYIRCCGFLYIRFGCAPEKLFDHLGEYCLDDEEFEPSKSNPSFRVTIGEYVEALLMDEQYYKTALPRIPLATKKRIEEKVAPVVQYRRRTVANKRALNLFREVDTPIAACINGEWHDGVSVALLEGTVSRIMVRCRLEGVGEETVHIGKVILREDRRGAGRRGRSRSRSPHRGRSPDWTRDKGKSDEDLVQDLRARQRERAVCSTGKDYARKPIGFMSGLATKRDVGVASSRLREEETYAPRQVEKRKQLTEEEELERRKEERAKMDSDRELQLRQQRLFEKYSTNNPKDKGASRDADAALHEAPEVLRLG